MASKTSVHLSSLPSSSSPHLQHHSKKQSLSKKRAESPPPPPVPTAIAKAREDISLRCLQRHDSAIRRIVCQAAFVSVYALSEDTKKWDRAHMQGGLHVVERDISCSLLEEEEEEGGRGGEQEKRGTSEDDEEEERREFKRKGREGWQNNSSKRKDKKEDSSSSSFPTSSFSSRIRWRLFVLNQRDTDILVENLDESFEMEGEKNHIFYRVTDQHTGSQRIQAIWVYDDKQRLAVQQALQSIIDECKLRRNFSHLPPLLSSTSCSSSSAAFSSSSLPARSSPAGEGKTGESQPGVVAPSGEDLRLYPEGAFSSSSFAPPSRKNSQHKAAGLHLLSLIRQGGSLSMAPSSPSSSSSSSPSLSLPYSSSDSISKGREGGEGEATGSAACETAGESRKQQKQSERRTTGDDEGGVNEKGGGRGDGDPNVLLSSGKKTGSHEKDLLNEESGMRIHVTDVNAAATAGQSILALVAPGKRHNKEASCSNVSSSSSSSSSLPALLPSPTLTPSRIPPDQRSRLGQDSADGGDMSPASLSLTNSGNVERSRFKEGRAKKDFLQENDHRREEDEEDLPVPGNAVTSTTATTATTAFCVEGGGGGGGSQYKTKTSISILSLLENRILRSKQGEEDLSQCQISEGEKNQREEEEERERRERNEASGHARHARRLGSEGRGGATSGEGEDREGRKEERKHPDRKTYRDKGGGTALLDMLKRRATPADGDLFKTATGDASQISSHCHTSLLQSSSSSSSSSSSLPPSLSSSFSSAHAYFESSSSSISASPPLLPCPHPSKASRKKAEGRSINNGGGGILLLPSQHRPDLSSSSSRHATVHPQRSHEENSSSSSCLSSSQSHQRRASSLSVQMGHSGVKTPGGEEEEEEGREKSEGLRKSSRNGKIITLPSHLNHSHDEDQRKSLTCGRSFVNRDDSILGLPSSSSSTPSSSPSLSSSSSPSSMRPSSSDPRRAGGGEGSEGVENYYLSLCINSSFSPIHPSTAPHRLANSTSHVRLSGNASSSDSASSSSACTVLNLSSSSGGHLEEEEEKKDTEERGEEGIVVGGGEGVSLSHAGGGEGTSKPNGVLSLLFGKTRQTGRKVEVSSLFVSGDRQQEIEEKESHRGGAGGEGEKKEEQERSENEEEEEGGGMIEVSRERLRSAVQTVMQSELFLDMVWRELKKQSSRNPNSQGMKREEKHEALSCHRSKNSRKKKNA